jgi:hypothetical protein
MGDFYLSWEKGMEDGGWGGYDVEEEKTGSDRGRNPSGGLDSELNGSSLEK